MHNVNQLPLSVKVMSFPDVSVELLSVSETRSKALLDFREMMLIFRLMLLLLQTAACESLSHQTLLIMLINH